ncbi:hypothetical protein, partial [Pseudomonas aeruginosa]|uniref:hypothetical protein n=1 Tax=Pseudomonas aeruginosa TaxID=287 RepID=UPI001C3FABF1
FELGGKRTSLLAHQTPLSRRGFSPKSVSGISRPLHINARPAMELRLSLTSSGRKRMVKIVDGEEVEVLPGEVQGILEAQKRDVGILADFLAKSLLARR